MNMHDKEVVDTL